MGQRYVGISVNIASAAKVETSHSRKYVDLLLSVAIEGSHLQPVWAESKITSTHFLAL